MGKATRWFRSLLGMKDKENVNSLNPGDRKDKRRWSFAKPLKESRVEAVFPPKDVVWLRSYMSETKKELNKHAVVAATATAAAQATVAVVRLTNHCRTIPYGGGREILAAVKIQTLFRSYLARKALRALKGLVKLQAFVRGFLVRKRAAATLHSMQALIRVQAAVISERARRSFTKDRQSGLEFRHRKSIGKFDNERPEFHSQRLSTYESNTNCYEESPKIVEIDTYRPHSRSRRINTCTSDSREESHSQSHYNSMPSPLPCKTPGCISIPEFHNLQDFELGFLADEYKYSNMAQSTPHFMNSKRSNGPATLAKSACGDSFFRPYSNYPSFMANTQSFNAKLRSHSAPKQRPKPGLKRDCLLMI